MLILFEAKIIAFVFYSIKKYDAEDHHLFCRFYYFSSEYFIWESQRYAMPYFFNNIAPFECKTFWHELIFWIGIFEDRPGLEDAEDRSKDLNREKLLQEVRKFFPHKIFQIKKTSDPGRTSMVKDKKMLICSGSHSGTFVKNMDHSFVFHLPPLHLSGHQMTAIC